VKSPYFLTILITSIAFRTDLVGTFAIPHGAAALAITGLGLKAQGCRSADAF
jgi:hypothetical protein